MSAQRERTLDWLHDDAEEDLVGADWHQLAIRTLADGLSDLATQCHWLWHVGDQLTLVGWKPDGAPWRPSPDIMIHPLAGPTPREEIAVRDAGPPALIVEVVSRTTWTYDVDITGGKGFGYFFMGVPEYLVFDPQGMYVEGQCRAWRRAGNAVEGWEPVPDGRYESASLGISFRPDGDLLRVFDPEGHPVPYSYEKTRKIAALEKELARLRGQNTPS